MGRPYDHAAYPHLGAPGGPWDAFDAEWCRTISMMFGSRLSKTFFGLCVSLFTAANAPSPMMMANATETLTKQVMERGYEMIRRRGPLRGLMASRHEKDWRQDTIEFRACKLFAAWARSVSTLADKDIKVGHAGEIDKWEQASTSKEADPLNLFTDRFKNYWSTRKTIFESTPTVKVLSRIEGRYLAGSACRLRVPCPKCKRFQVLVMGTEAGPHGLKWNRAESWRTDPAIARGSARYVCEYCHVELHDHQRPWMIRRGVWVPAGCGVDHEAALQAAEERMRPANLVGEPNWQGWKHSPWVTGTPDRDGPDQSYQLSSLYALSLSWGDIACEFAECYDKPQKIRNFINQWLAETWEPRRTKSTPERIAERLGTDRPEGTVPLWAKFLTVTIDQQAADGGFVVFVVEAHGPEDRCAVVRRGLLNSLHEAWEQVIRAEYPAEDAGRPFVPLVTGIDSGWNTKATYEFCSSHPGCIPIKGSDGDLSGQPYTFATIGDKSRTGAVGQALLHVNTDYWETDLQYRLDEKLAGEAGALELCREAALDWDFIGQLCNATLTDKIDSRGNARLLWVKKRESDPNDYRDAVRYGLCLARAWLDEREGEYPQRAAPTGTVSTPVIYAGDRRPDGREWLE